MEAAAAEEEAAAAEEEEAAAAAAMDVPSHMEAARAVVGPRVEAVRTAVATFAVHAEDCFPASLRHERPEILNWRCVSRSSAAPSRAARRGQKVPPVGRS